MTKLKVALVGVGLVVIERLGDDLIDMLDSGLLTPVIKALVSLATGAS